MTTLQKLWFGFGTFTALLALSSVAVLVPVRSIERDVQTLFALILLLAGVAVGAVLVFRDVIEQRRQHQAEQRLRFLAEAGNVLADVQDLGSTLRRVAHLTLPFFADWCVVDLLGEDNQIKRVATAHADPEKEPLLHEMQAGYPATWKSESPVVRVLRTGQPELRARIPASLLQSVARDAEHLQIVETLNPTSFIVAPLTVRGETFGTMGFVRSGPSPSYGPADLELAQEVARRAAISIDNARLFQRIKTADRRKNEFLATLAHELRNPLAPIRNAAEILKLKGPPDPALQAARDMIDRQILHMVRLIEDLLDVSRISRGKLELRTERVELAAVVNQALEATWPHIEGAGHELTVSLPPKPVYLDADPVRLAQVLSNLLNNAAKYTEERGRIWLTAESEGTDLVVKVKDTGIGISAEHLPRLFEMFSQVPSALGRSQGGLGIGLSLVRGLVEMHGGSIEAHSDGPGKGSEFVVRLPVRAETPAPQPPQPENREDSRRRRPVSTPISPSQWTATP